MRVLNQLTLLLVIVGGLNWGLIGLAGFDLVAAIFGAMSTLSKLVYILVGASALWQLIRSSRASRTVKPEPRLRAERFDIWRAKVAALSTALFVAVFGLVIAIAGLLAQR